MISAENQNFSREKNQDHNFKLGFSFCWKILNPINLPSKGGSGFLATPEGLSNSMPVTGLIQHKTSEYFFLIDSKTNFVKLESKVQNSVLGLVGTPI